VHDPGVLPEGLPAPPEGSGEPQGGAPDPEDDGAAGHLPGAVVPRLALPASDGRGLRVDRAPGGERRLVLYAYPRTGRPGVEPLVADWDRIPGARGCTPEACGFRDHAAELRAAGAAVAGVSTQQPAEQREAAERLRLPFPLLSDAELRLATALRLPTFEVAGHTLLRRLTLVVRGGRVEHAFYPVFPPDAHAAEVLAWLRAHPAGAGP
jgi:peroxiredoxin